MTCTRTREIQRAISALCAIPCPPSREAWWPIVGNAIDADIPEEFIRTWCESGPGFSEADFRATYRSLAQRPRTGQYGALFKIARESGWIDDSIPILSPIERKRRREEVGRRALETAAKQNKSWSDASEKAWKIWHRGSTEIVSHGYHSTKTLGGTRQLSFGANVRRGTWPQNKWDDALLVPIYSNDSKIMSLEAISPTGEKRSLKSGAKSGGIYPLAKFSNHQSGVVIVAEGLATAAACMQATGYPAVVAFCDSNLKKAAQSVRLISPNAQIIIAADIGSEDKARLAAAAVGGAFAVPDGIPGIRRGIDFWDIWAFDGGDVLVKHTIDAALKSMILIDDEIDAEQPTAGFLPMAAAATDSTSGVWPARPTPASISSPKLRTIQVIPGELPAAVDQAEASLVEQCQDIYQQAGMIVRPVQAMIDVAEGQQVDCVRLSQVSKHHLAERLTAAAKWEKYDSRAGEFVQSDCPLKIAETYMARDGSWRLKKLEGIIVSPTLRPDGSILDIEGFDQETGLLLYGDQTSFKAIPNKPSMEDAQEALNSLLELIDSFPFVGNYDKSVALSGILTVCIRRSLPTAPMHCFSAPTAGSGKSMLVDLASIIACGHQAAVMSQGRDETEQEKRLASALLAGDQVITLDNATMPIDGDLLCQVLTQRSVRLRVLGASALRTVPTNVAFFATGNCLLVQGDMTRRALLCSLDPECERPELRTFQVNPKDIAERNRTKFLCDALTILRAFHIAGRPQPQEMSSLGSFEIWSEWVRGALLWLGQADPVQTMEKARVNDPKLEAIVAVMSQWREVIGSKEVMVRQVISEVTEAKLHAYGDNNPDSKPATGRDDVSTDDFREALLTVAGTGGTINSRSLGKWLATNSGRMVTLPAAEAGKSRLFRFVQSKVRHSVKIWKLEEVKGCA